MALRTRTNGSAIPMDPGERTCRVTIEQLSESRGASSFPVESWTPLVTVWMRRMMINPVRADYSEKFLEAQVSQQPQAQWEMGYRSDMDETLVNVAKRRRLRYQGRTYNIVAADVIGAREGIELLTISDGGA
jgi:head-tail adaptor